MASVTDHYANHLAPIYLWMAGGMEAALNTGRDDLAAFMPVSGFAVDLGAGFGMHSIPLAHSGYQVVAIDQSATLLDILKDRAVILPIQTIEANLLEFRSHITEQPDLIICMGDTLTHLESLEQVEFLCAEVSQSLARNGTFVTTFRDYSTAAVGEGRFIPVRSDADRILTCFLEEEPTHVNVHDIVHERAGNQWNMRVSSYRKLRLSPSFVERIFQNQKMNVRVARGPRGMIRMEVNG